MGYQYNTNDSLVYNNEMGRYKTKIQLRPPKAKQPTQYAPVNAWALHRLFKKLNLPKDLRFIDLWCGLGASCLQQNTGLLA
jgi:hypothetical protein